MTRLHEALNGAAAEATDLFHSGADDFDAALAGWESAAERLREAQTLYREATRQLEYREAELTISPEIDGRNAEVRKAQVVILCAQDGTYQALLADAERQRTEVAKRADEVQAERDRLSVHKRRMDFALAYLRALTQED